MAKFPKNIIAEVQKTMAVLAGFSSEPSDLKVSDMVIGGKVEMVNSDGSLSPAQDGEYTIDNDVIVVKDGLIVSINGETETNPRDEAPKQEENLAEDAPVDEPVKQDDLKAEVEALKAETENIKAMVEELKAALASKNEAEQKMSADFAAEIAALNETLKIVATTPAEFSKTSTNNVVKDSKEDKMKEYARILKSSKN
jgi:hypothetical protein